MRLGPQSVTRRGHQSIGTHSAHVAHPGCRELGATAVEYGLIVGLIAAVIVAAVTVLGGSVAGSFSQISDLLP